ARIESDRLVVVGNGAVVIALGLIGIAAAVVCARILWLEPDRLGVVGDRAIVIALGLVGVATAAKCIGKFWIEPYRFVVVDGAILVALGLIGVSAIGVLKPRLARSGADRPCAGRNRNVARRGVAGI